MLQILSSIGNIDYDLLYDSQMDSYFQSEHFREKHRYANECIDELKKTLNPSQLKLLNRMLNALQDEYGDTSYESYVVGRESQGTIE